MRDQLLGDRYRLVRLLGEGGMGQVWEARDEKLHRPVAVKVVSLLAGGGSRGNEARARFLREARLTARLQHPDIVTIHDLGETGSGQDRVPFLVMELVRGDGLDTVLRDGPVAPAVVARWGARICDALDEAHRAGITHRDIKPSNVLTTPNGGIKVLDFGVARAADPAATGGQLTRPGFIVGTPAYMAPEQARGLPEPRSDLYALGCLLFELLTGRLPFHSPDPVGYLSAHLTETPPAPGSVARGVPPAWDDLVLTLLRKDPDERYQDAATLATALRDLAASGAPRTPRTPRTPTAPAAPGWPTRPPTRPRTVPHPRPPAVGATATAGWGPPPEAAGRTARAAARAALLCLPGLLTMFGFGAFSLSMQNAPHYLIVVNLLVGAAEMAGLGVGARQLRQGLESGRRLVAVAAGAAALHWVSVSAQFTATGGDMGLDEPGSLLVFALGPLMAILALVTLILALHPATGRWCRAGAATR